MSKKDEIKPDPDDKQSEIERRAAEKRSQNAGKHFQGQGEEKNG